MIAVDFPHSPPEGYSYETEPFQRHVIAIWIHHHRRFDYNHGDEVRCIWGLYNTKTRKYHAPINATKVGDVVSISRTTPYSAMPLKQTPLEAAYV